MSKRAREDNGEASTKRQRVSSVTMEIAPGRLIGDGQPTFFIAEAGVNHMCKLEHAKELIQLAKDKGADCVKFQKRTVEANFTVMAMARPYTSAASFGPTYGEHKHNMELSFDDWREMKRYADELGILFTASGMDEASVDFLCELGVPFLKVGSPDMYNKPLLEHIASKKLPVVLSTGMAPMADARRAYDILTSGEDAPSVCVLHCTSTYPCPPSDIHLNNLATFKAEFPDAVIGYSGHEQGIGITLAAVALGAQLVERHITIDHSWKGNDHKSSLDPPELEQMMRELRAVDAAMGGTEKVRRESEVPVFNKTAKTIVAAADLTAGTEIARASFNVKNSAEHGACPLDYTDLIGKKLKADVKFDHPITFDMVE